MHDRLTLTLFQLQIVFSFMVATITLYCLQEQNLSTKSVRTCITFQCLHQQFRNMLSKHVNVNKFIQAKSKLGIIIIWKLKQKWIINLKCKVIHFSTTWLSINHLNFTYLSTMTSYFTYLYNNNDKLSLILFFD